MTIPKGFVFVCPGCDTPLEMYTRGWQLGKAVDQEGCKGVGIELTAWSNHECGKSK